MKSKHTMLLAGALLSTQALQAAEVKVTTDITTNTTWTKNNVYILEDSIFVKNGATLTIEAGTWVLGTQKAGANVRGSLIVTRNGKINAVGTKKEPIVFTAKQEYDGVALDPAAGDAGLWGGIIILGNAPVNNYTSPTTNSNEGEIEGFPAGSTDDIRYGGRRVDDNSGTMKYCSIRFGGYEFAPNEEINALTLGGVGNGTVIENIELVSNLDDGLEIFGGTVNTKRIAVAFAQDDSFDLDSGHQGNHQFWFALQNGNSSIGDRGGEWDGGNGEVKDQAPYTTPRIFNVTLIGDGVGNTESPNFGVFIDDNFAGQIHNALIHDFSGDMVVASSDGLGNPPDPTFTNTTFGAFGGTEANLDLFAGSGVQTVANPQIGGISRTPNGALDPRPASGSPLLTAPLSTIPGGGFFEAAPYRGAFAPDENWLDGWSYLSQKGYLPAPVDPNAPVFTSEPKSTVAAANATVRLTAAATADGEVTYQWFRNDQPIPGATSATYEITKLTGKTAGEYYVEATLDGEFTSKSAIATVQVAKLTVGKLNAKVGKAFRAKVSSNFRANSFKALGLPSGLSINNKGVISGKPMRKGSFLIKVTGRRVVGGKAKTTAELTKTIRVR